MKLRLVEDEWPASELREDTRDETAQVLETRALEHVVSISHFGSYATMGEITAYGVLHSGLEGLAEWGVVQSGVGEEWGVAQEFSPFPENETMMARARLRGIHEPHLELKALRADIAALAHSHRRLASEVRELRAQRENDEVTKSRLERGMRTIGRLRSFYDVRGEDLSLFEHLGARHNLADALAEAALKLRETFEGVKLELSWEDATLYVVAKVRSPSEEAEERLFDLLSWWRKIVHVDDRATLTVDYA